ncbi:uncharacterized protein LOC119077489 isoform X2 [Bradysia coprophila]|uniref:uncharacterized protein LOC119077489 isoform X2 n=1 Tax=Bradysia coprophila TaxID=38358 RepID=UPI00187D74FB|nr:uncharacterized protein LOC119077489 isoform X2 [Bradysia coprophila]
MLFALQLALPFLCTTVWLARDTLAGLPPPPNFPSHIPLRNGDYENWSNELSVPNLWFATPSNGKDVQLLANWAFLNNYTVRASGQMHNWPPMTVTAMNKVAKNVVLVDTTKKLTAMQLTPSPYPNTSAVRVGCGVTIHNLLTFLEANGLGVAASPSIGDITIGGVLAIGGHGTSVLAVGEEAVPGFSYGSISNLVISLTAVVWDATTKSYVLKTFKRSEADTKAFLVNLGRTIITEVVLIVGPNYNLRCESRADILSDELFADPANVHANSRTFSRFLDETGRIETIQFPFSNTPWLKKWSVCTNRPANLLARRVSSPYNYVLTNIFPEFLSMVVGNVTNGLGLINPILGPAQSLVSTVGNLAFLSFDIWGPSKNLLLYVKSSTLRQTASGVVVITKQANVQSVVSQATAFYKQLLREYSARGVYPINGVIEIRATALDHHYTVVPDGEAPLLSPVFPVKDRPDLDTALWIAVLSFDKAPHQAGAFQKIERFFHDVVEGDDAVVRIYHINLVFYVGIIPLRGPE